jgi:hypothetical protein
VAATLRTPDGGVEIDAGGRSSHARGGVFTVVGVCTGNAAYWRRRSGGRLAPPSPSSVLVRENRRWRIAGGLRAIRLQAEHRGRAVARSRDGASNMSTRSVASSDGSGIVRRGHPMPLARRRLRHERWCDVGAVRRAT